MQRIGIRKNIICEELILLFLCTNRWRPPLATQDQASKKFHDTQKDGRMWPAMLSEQTTEERPWIHSSLREQDKLSRAIYNGQRVESSLEQAASVLMNDLCLHSQRGAFKELITAWWQLVAERQEKWTSKFCSNLRSYISTSESHRQGVWQGNKQFFIHTIHMDDRERRTWWMDGEWFTGATRTD